MRSGRDRPHVGAAAETEQAAAAVAALHRLAFGGEPDGVWAAPGRVTLIGEHVDYNAGRTLLIALPYQTVVAARRRADDQVRVVSAQEKHGWTGRLADLAPGAFDGWTAYARPGIFRSTWRPPGSRCW